MKLNFFNNIFLLLFFLTANELCLFQNIQIKCLEYLYFDSSDRHTHVFTVTENQCTTTTHNEKKIMDSCKVNKPCSLTIQMNSVTEIP